MGLVPYVASFVTGFGADLLIGEGDPIRLGTMLTLLLQQTSASKLLLLHHFLPLLLCPLGQQRAEKHFVSPVGRL